MTLRGYFVRIRGSTSLKSGFYFPPACLCEEREWRVAVAATCNIFEARRYSYPPLNFVLHTPRHVAFESLLDSGGIFIKFHAASSSLACGRTRKCVWRAKVQAMASNATINWWHQQHQPKSPGYMERIPEDLQKHWMRECELERHPLTNTVCTTRILSGTWDAIYNSHILHTVAF